MYTARQPQIPPFGKNFSWSLEKSNELSDRIIILGDLNVDFLNIPPSHIIRDILQHNNFTKTIHEPTRITHSTQTYISLQLNYDTRHAYKRKIWPYKDADTDKLNYLIETFDWKNLLENTYSVEIASDKFTTEYLKLVRECIPEKTLYYVNLSEYEIDLGKKRCVQIDTMTGTSINISILIN